MNHRLGLLEGLGIARGWKASARTIATRQAERLQQMVRHAYENVAYYRRLFDNAGIPPDRIRSVSDLSAIPVTTRRELQSVPVEDRIPRGIEARAMQHFVTSGTTGRPLDVHQTARDVAINDMLALRTYLFHGMRPWHKKTGLRAPDNMPKDRNRAARLGLFRRSWIKVGPLEKESAAVLCAEKPDFVIGYSTALGLIARELRESGIREVRPKCVMTLAMVLDPKTRRDIEEGFGCPVRDVYASWEGGMMAWECGRCPGYHIHADWVIIEILRGNRPALPGEAGDVVLTNLHSYGMPFIRYRIGDVAVRNAKLPACGCELPLLGEVFGRTGDLVIAPDGRTLSPHSFFRILDLIPGLLRWRLVQRAKDRYYVEVIPGPGYGPDAEAAIRKGFCDILEQQVAVEIVTVANPDWAEDSKFRPIISEVGNEASLS